MRQTYPSSASQLEEATARPSASRVLRDVMRLHSFQHGDCFIFIMRYGLVCPMYSPKQCRPADWIGPAEMSPGAP